MEINEFDFLQDIVDAQEKADADASKQEEPKTPDVPETDDVDDTDDAPDEEPTKEDAPKDEDPDDTDAEDYEPYFNFLKEQGVIKVDDKFEFDGTEDSFMKALDASKVAQRDELVQEIWNALPENGRPLLSYFLEGGTDVNKYLNAYAEVDYDNLDLEDEDNQIKVLRQYYKEIFKYNEEKTDKLLTRLQAKEALKEGALDAVEDLKEHRKELQAKLVEDAKQERLKAQEKADRERKLIVDSIKEIDTTRQSKLEAMLFNPVKTESGVTTEFNYYLNKISDSPKHLVQLADLLLDYSPDKGFNLERFEQRVMSAKTKSLKALIDSKSSPKKSTSQGAPTPRSEEKYFPFDKFLNN